MQLCEDGVNHLFQKFFLQTPQHISIHQCFGRRIAEIGLLRKENKRVRAQNGNHRCGYYLGH